jgi:hypothetical protein
METFSGSGESRGFWVQRTFKTYRCPEFFKSEKIFLKFALFILGKYLKYIQNLASLKNRYDVKGAKK